MVLTRYTKIRGLHLSINEEFLAISSLFFNDYVAKLNNTQQWQWLYIYIYELVLARYNPFPTVY